MALISEHNSPAGFLAMMRLGDAIPNPDQYPFRISSRGEIERRLLIATPHDAGGFDGSLDATFREDFYDQLRYCVLRTKAQYELAEARMQLRSQVVDFSKAAAACQGPLRHRRHLTRIRRLLPTASDGMTSVIERGVRFIQLCHLRRRQRWDGMAHGDINTHARALPGDGLKPIAGLIRDPRLQRGMLDDTG